MLESRGMYSDGKWIILFKQREEKYEVTVFGLNLKFHKCVVSIQLPVTHKNLLVNVFSGD